MNADSGVPVTRLKVDGGMTANHLLMQFVADVLDVPVERPLGSEAVSLGAAYAAGSSVRAYWHAGHGRGASSGRGEPVNVRGRRTSNSYSSCSIASRNAPI